MNFERERKFTHSSIMDCAISTTQNCCKIARFYCIVWLKPYWDKNVGKYITVHIHWLAGNDDRTNSNQYFEGVRQELKPGGTKVKN